MKDTDILNGEILIQFGFTVWGTKYFLGVEPKKNLVLDKYSFEKFYFVMIGDPHEDLFIKLYTVGDLKKVLNLFNIIK